MVQASSNTIVRRIVSILVLAIGGALFAYGAIWAIQATSSLFSGSRILANGEYSGVWGLAAGWMIAALPGYLVLHYLVSWRSRLSCMVVLAWIVGYLLLWLAGVILGGVTLPIFLAFWLVFGVLGSLMVGTNPTAKYPHGRTNTVIRSSQFGRIPQDTVVLLARHVSHASGPIAGGLPAHAPSDAREYTVRAVLDHTLTDWWSNGNAEGLTPKDVADLRSFVELAASLAGSFDHQGMAIYRAGLAALLDDWLEHWNANGVDGPPRRA